MKVIAVIPARYSSTRLPAKPLVDLNGKTLIMRVYEAVLSTELFDQVIVATDDQRIFSHCQSIHAEVKMTSANHHSGSDRIAEVCQTIDTDIVVNVQGDEPFISVEPLKDLIQSFDDQSVNVASLMHLLENEEDINNPNYVKVVVDELCNALYFSRSVIPYNRNYDVSFNYYKHIGVYAYRKNTLLDFVKMKPSLLENIEKLEQLRLLSHGISIKMILTNYKGIGIDTLEDLEKARVLLRGIND